MNELEIGDRVEVIDEPIDGKNLFGEMGKVVAFGGDFDALFDETDLIGVEFDNNILGHDCCGGGKDGHCWWVDGKYLKKIEDTEEETKEAAEDTKADTLEQKILTALREEIGVDIGEKFDVYKNEKKQWTCKFEETGFFREMDDDFYKSEAWKDIIYSFYRYTFKRKLFIPRLCQKYFYLEVEDLSDGPLFDGVGAAIWVGDIEDYGMLALGNVFRNEEEALKHRDELLERLEKLRNGE